MPEKAANAEGKGRCCGMRSRSSAYANSRIQVDKSACSEKFNLSAMRLFASERDDTR